MADRIKVLIVDDSALVRQVIAQALSTDPDIEVIGTAPDPIFAIQKMKSQWPDVLVIDIEMPRMDGITFLKNYGAASNPVVICSSLAEEGAQATFEALSAGAISIITKPKIGLKSFLRCLKRHRTGGAQCGARQSARFAGRSLGGGCGAGAQTVRRRDA